MEEKNNRGLKEIKPIFRITMLDYFPHIKFTNKYPRPSKI